MSEETVTAPVTPGQAAYEAMHKSRIARGGSVPGDDYTAWDALDEPWDGGYNGLRREDMEAAAQAAIEATPDFATAFHDDVTELRALVAEILSRFDHTAAGNWSSLVVGYVFAEWRERAGLEAVRA